MAKKAQRRIADDWQTVIYETSSGARPAIEYLMDSAMPAAVRRELLVTIAAVTKMGPPRFPTSTQRWRIMRNDKKKGAGSVDMSGICEARDKHAKLLYRLFCVIDRNAPDHGLAAPSLVLLGGATKPDNAVVPTSEYQVIDGYRTDYQAKHRIAKDTEGSAFWPDFTDHDS
jgi:hypothetical protein